MAYLIPALYLLLLLSTFTVVIWRGGWPERAGIIVMLAGSVTSYFVAHVDWRGNELGIFAVDVVALLAFVVILARTNRYWPIWVTALEIVAVMTHLARMLKPATVPLAYALAEQVWSYVMIAIILVSSLRYRSSSNDSTSSAAG